MKHIQKYFWVYSIVMILMGLFLDLNFNEAEIIEIEIPSIDVNGNKTTVTHYEYIPKYKILPILSNILYSTSVALLLLFLIDKRIDMQESRVLSEKINQNIFNGVLKKLVPEKLFNQVRQDIFNNDVIRKNAKWTYQISKNANDSFDVSQSIIYEIENLTEDKIEKDINVKINFSTDISETKITKWVLKSLNKEIIKEETSDFDKIVVELNPKETKIVELSIKSEYKTPAVMDTHVSNFSIVGLDIQIQKPENCDVIIQPSFTTKLNKSEPNPTLITYDKVDCILLGQGISYIIKKKN